MTLAEHQTVATQRNLADKENERNMTVRERGEEKERGGRERGNKGKKWVKKERK